MLTLATTSSLIIKQYSFIFDDLIDRWIVRNLCFEQIVSVSLGVMSISSSDNGKCHCDNTIIAIAASVYLNVNDDSDNTDSVSGHERDVPFYRGRFLQLPLVTVPRGKGAGGGSFYW